MHRIRYAAKRLLGPTLANRIGTWKHELHARVAHAIRGTTAADTLPWCSPNTFGLVVAAYRHLPLPSIHEYGSGASTLCHLRELLQIGGTLTAVEHDSAWAERVRVAALAMLTRPRCREGASTAGDEVTTVGGGGSVDDVEYRAQAANGAEARFALKVRPPSVRSTDPDGTAEEFRQYVLALDRPADMVIVDGRARKACIRHVLDNELLRPGGAIALFEAGRGVEGWLDAPALKGTSNYQPEVERMMALGAQIIDGTGYDSWPGQSMRRSFGSLSKHYPLELCLLRLPDGMGIAASMAARGG